MKLTEHALTAAPLLRIIAAGGDLSNAALAKATGRDARNMPRDLSRLADAGWIAREPGSPPELTEEGREILTALARAEGEATPVDAAAVELPLHLIDEAPASNPRTRFDEEPLDNLAASIGDRGVLQPIMVRPSPEVGRYLVVMGSRRRRAAIAAGLFTIPAVVRALGEAEAFEVATIENMQRQDMNPMEDARAFDRIIRDAMAKDPDLKLKDAKELIAARLRKSPRFVELRLQLLTLPAIKQCEVEEGVTSPKDAIAWVRQQPKLHKLTPAQWLVAFEVYDKVERLPRPKKHDYETASTLVCREGFEAVRADDALKSIASSPMYMIGYPHEVFENGRTGYYSIGRGYSKAQLDLKAEGDVDDAATRMTAISFLRAECGITAALGEGEYATPWLNGPFDPTPEIVAEILEEEAGLAAQRVERDAEQNTIRVANAARRAAIAAIEARARRTPPAFAMLPELPQLAADETGAALPWTATDDGRILDANGRELFEVAGWKGPLVVARLKLIALAANTAAGLLMPEAPPETSDPSASEPLDDLEGDDFGDDEDDDTPDFLRHTGSAVAEVAQ